MPALTCHEIDEQLDGYFAGVCEHERRAAAAIERVERDESLKAHLDAMGMPDAEAYRQWCRRHGLSTRLAKSTLARDDELDLMRSIDAWRFAPEDHDRLIRLRRFARRGAAEKPRRAVEKMIVDYGERYVGSSIAARKRYCQLVTGFAVGFRRFLRSKNIPAVVVESIAMIAHQATQLVCDPESWPGSFESNEVKHALNSFTQHCLVRYEDPPKWLQEIWHNPERLGSMWVEAYIRVGQGYGLHRCDTPFHLSKRAAREACDAPRQMFSRHALRYGQAIACGSSHQRAVAIATSGLAWVDDPFGLTVIEWLSNHRDFPTDRIHSLVSYAEERREEKHWTMDRRGRWVQKPIDPNWSIKGRTPHSLLRDLDAASLYDSESNRKTFAEAEPRERPERVSLSGDKDLWFVVPLTNEEEFIEEGAEMRHCVASYHSEAEEGQLKIFSLRRSNGSRLDRRVTVCVRPAIGVSEARGFANRDPSQKEMRVLATWAKKRRIKMNLMEV